MSEPVADPPAAVQPDAQPTAAEQPILAADSFRVRGMGRSAEVRGFARHLERFSRTAREAAADAGRRDPEFVRQLEQFLGEARASIAEFGDGFPRLQLLGPSATEPRGALQLSLLLRARPHLGDTLSARSVSSLHRSTPHRKGPNFAAYARLNSTANAGACAEALIFDGSGHLIEGATTSCIWWNPATGAGHFAASQDRVSSVTEALIREYAGSAALTPSTIRLADLTRHEVWAVNALHGIRVVTEIDGVPLPAPRESRLRDYRRALEAHWEPVSPRLDE